MSYCDQAAIALRITPSELVGLTDDSGSGSVDASVVTEAIAAADAVIDGFLRGRVALPLTVSPVPALLRQAAVDLSIWNLFTRRTQAGELPQGITLRYQEAMKTLRGIASGDIAIFDSSSAVTEESGTQTNKDSTSREFNDEDVWDYY
jgi:phage gp36-like protein